MSASSAVRMRGPMTEYRAGFDATLASRGYTDLSRAQQLRLMARLSEWLVEQAVEPAALDDVAIEAFLQARRRAGYTSWLSRRGLAPLLAHLRGVGAVPPPVSVVDLSQRGRLLARYQHYLVSERGLGASASRLYLQVARRFVDAHADPAGLGELTSADVAAFVIAESGQGPVRPVVLTGLRCLLRWSLFEGVVATDLTGAVPRAAGWKASLPRGVPTAHLAAVLAACDRRRGVGRRDFAMITVISRLGLRASETAALSLDDIDWRSGDVIIRGKGRRDERLPLPDDVGEAIVAYLQRGRPACPAREVFLPARAPWRRLGQPSVTDIVYRACDRAGVERVGAHRLRHTAATQMLHRGASLAEVAQVLRHHDPATTSTYAKVDRAALAALAQPWPGTSR